MNARTRELYVEQRWEMYEFPSGASAGIGIRNKATQRKVAHVPPGPHDLDAARLIEAAPQLLEACELAYKYVNHPVDGRERLAAYDKLREVIARARGN